MAADNGSFVMEALEWQAHDVRVAALDPADEAPARALDRVGPGLVVGLTRGDVRVDLEVGVGPHEDAADDGLRHLAPAGLGVSQHHGRHHLVAPAPEGAQHGARVAP
jgi:hypothetical protein